MTATWWFDVYHVLPEGWSLEGAGWPPHVQPLATPTIMRRARIAVGVAYQLEDRGRRAFDGEEVIAPWTAASTGSRNAPKPVAR